MPDESLDRPVYCLVDLMKHVVRFFWKIYEAPIVLPIQLAEERACLGARQIGLAFPGGINFVCKK